ncbi:DUF4129 domain-containing protein [Streptomyces sp. CA-111067]|uniref:DUF4129 domain-containing protein n=1 Tax=Streptomyces sp. CA-111067 TaxID=3240046 RepID=UPI003D95183F
MVTGDLPTILLALGWGVLCAALLIRHRGQVGHNASLDPVELRLVQAVRAALLAFAVAVPAGAIALHRLRRRPYHEPPPKPAPLPALQPSAPPNPPPPESGHSPLWYVVLVVIALVFLAGLAYAYVRLREELGGKPPQAPSAEPPLAAGALADAVASGRRALLDGSDARAAVIACYVAMEASLAGSGVVREDSDTPTDLLRRVADSGLDIAADAAALTDLFREARYSSHPMSDAQRDRAAAALNGLAAQLGAGESV